MEQPIEASGRTVEEAIELALRQLGAKRDEVEIEVLSRGKPGFLGFGAELARVRLIRTSALETDEEKPRPRPRAVTQPPAAAPPFPEPPRVAAARVEPAQAPQAPAISREEFQAAQEVLERLLALMHVKAQASEGSSPAESPGTPVLQVTGEDAGLLIGRGGETLRALQLLTNMIATKSAPNRGQVIVDVERYRERRAEALRRLARRIADRVASSGRPFTLEPMSPYERRLIHITLAEDPRVTTESIGEGDDRKVSVRPRQTGAESTPGRATQGRSAPRGRGGGGRYRPSPGPAQNGAPGPPGG